MKRINLTRSAAAATALISLAAVAPAFAADMIEAAPEPAPVEVVPTESTGWAGGYVGHGVTATNLAGRTLADLVLGRQTPLTELPWVGHRSRKLGAPAAALARRAWALRRLQAGGRARTSPIARVADVITRKPH